MFNHELVAVRRTELGLSQRKLAKLLGWSYQVILRMERGADQSDLTLGQLRDLATVLQVQPQQLLTPGLPAATNDTDGDQESELDAASVRLLRRIQTDRDVSRTLSRPDRELVLPQLVKRGLVDARRRLVLTELATLALHVPEDGSSDDDERGRVRSGRLPSRRSGAGALWC